MDKNRSVKGNSLDRVMCSMIVKDFDVCESKDFDGEIGNYQKT